MYTLISLMLICACIHMQTIIRAGDFTPEGYVQRLEQLQSKRFEKSAYTPEREWQMNNDVSALRESTREQIERFSGEEYVPYFCALAASNINDDLKISKELVFVPPIQNICKGDAQRVHLLLGQCNSETSSYAVARLLLAALAHGYEIGRYKEEDLLGLPLAYDDLPLVTLYLNRQVDPNAYRPLGSCRSLEMARLLVAHGANVQMQNGATGSLLYFNDLVSGVLSRWRTLKKPRNMLQYFLLEANLEWNNSQGRDWIESLNTVDQQDRAYAERAVNLVISLRSKKSMSPKELVSPTRKIQDLSAIPSLTLPRSRTQSLAL